MALTMSVCQAMGLFLSKYVQNFFGGSLIFKLNDSIMFNGFFFLNLFRNNGPHE